MFLYFWYFSKISTCTSGQVSCKSTFQELNIRFKYVVRICWRVFIHKTKKDTGVHALDYHVKVLKTFELNKYLYLFVNNVWDYHLNTSFTQKKAFIFVLRSRITEKYWQRMRSKKNYKIPVRDKKHRQHVWQGSPPAKPQEAYRPWCNISWAQ